MEKTLLRKTYVLGVLIFISSMDLVSAELKTECISSALCYVLQGDIHKDSNQSFKNAYEKSDFEIKKYLKFKECGIEKINERCAHRGIKCMSELKSLAAYNYGSRGLTSEVFKDCSVGAWSYVLFLCKYQQSWPKLVTDNLPEEFKICNSSCSSMIEFDKYHRKNGKTDVDFPKFWKAKLKMMEDNKNLTAELSMEAGYTGGAVEKRQRSEFDPTTWQTKDVVESLTFGNEFIAGDAVQASFCDRDTFITHVLEFLPIKIFFFCTSRNGTRNPQRVVNAFYSFPFTQEGRFDTLLRPEEVPNIKGDTAPTRNMGCKDNKYKLYQVEFPVLVGAQFRINRGIVESGRYLCAGDPILTGFTKEQKRGDRPEITSSQRCPPLTAVCSIAGTLNRNNDIVHVSMGCCRVQTPSQHALVFDYVPYSWNGATRDQRGPLDSKFTSTYTYSAWNVNGRLTWLCPPNYFIDSFQSSLVFPASSTSLCNRDCSKYVDYIFATRLYCNAVQGRSDRQELKYLGAYWSTIFVRREDEVLLSQNQTCTQGFYTGGEFQCDDADVIKKFKCGNQFQVGVRKFFPARRPGETSGFWKYTPYENLRERFPSLPDFHVEFKCPSLTALCGVGVTGYRNRDGRKKIEMSIESLYYDYLCCPINIQLCTESEIRLQLDPIPSQCNIPEGVNGTCIISYSNRILEVYENNSNTVNMTTDKTTFSVNGMVGVTIPFVVNATIGPAFGYNSISEKVKMYGFDDTYLTSDALTVNTTQLFFIDKGRTLLTYRPYIYCGGFKVGSRTVISIQTPSTDCKPEDDWTLFDDISPVAVEKKMNINYIGYGTRWVSGRRADQIDIPWTSIITNLPFKFTANPFLTISSTTKFRWQSADKSTFEEYNSTESFFEYTIKPGFRHKFFRVLGKCGRDWQILPKVTAQNVKVDLVPV